MASYKHMKARRARLFACAMVFFGAASLIPDAQAQWRVKDDDAIKVLGAQSDGTISKNTKDTRDRLTINTFDAKALGNRMGDPTVALAKPSATAQLDDGASCKNLNDKQQPVCQQIIKLENAQYQYMLTVYDTSNTRNEVLKQLLADRQKLNENDFGRMEDNTNRLTALYNLIALDRQQMDSVNYAYHANIVYLNKRLALMAKSAQKGQDQEKGGLGTITVPGVGSTIDLGALAGGVVTGAVLQEALDGVQSNEPAGFKTLAIEKN